MCGGDQLQELLRIVEPLLKFRPKALRGKLRGHRDFAGGGIGGHKFHFVDANGRSLGVAEAFLDLLGKILRLGAANSESAH